MRSNVKMLFLGRNFNAATVYDEVLIAVNGYGNFADLLIHGILSNDLF